MELINQVASLSITKKTNENAGFLLANKKGSYCSFFNVPASRYEGLFYFDEKEMGMYKFIESIDIAGLHDGKVYSLKNSLFFAERKKSGIAESFLMPKGFSSLIYELSRQNEIDIVLDCKNSYDNRQWGRYYDIFEENGCIVVRFTKRTDEKEDFSSGREEFVLYLAIKSKSLVYHKNDKWLKREYAYDKERKSVPFVRFVYNALRLRGQKFVFSMSKDKNEAIKECKYVFSNANKLKNQEKQIFLDFLKNNSVKKIVGDKSISKEIRIAYANAANSLNNLIADGKDSCGIFAGLPWFFQFWSRDALVSLKAISKISSSKNKIFEQMIFYYLNNICQDGRLPNLIGKNSSGMLGSSDAHGWLFLRCSEFVKEIRTEKNEAELLKISYEIEGALEKSLHGLLKEHTKDSLEINGPKETWMDTNFGNDNREGARIEIQSLRLSMYKLMHELSSNQKYSILENMLKIKVREKFFNGKIFADGLEDPTARPNIFIAAYAYPKLLSDKEWEICFDAALQSLWLEWGGLATIDKSSILFTDTNSGEDTKSYHRGDSWFWINNLAALVLNKANKKKFKGQISQIIRASTEELLWKGCIGCHAELSSAKELSSKGCFNQAWSNAMYIEMVDEVFKK